MSKPDGVDLYWAKVFGNAQVMLTGASADQIKVVLFDTLAEFFGDSNCWKENIDIVVVPNTYDYPIPVRTGRILRLAGVVDQNLTPQNAIMPTIGTVRFQFGYSNTQTMTVTVIKTVTDPLECFPPHIPDWVLPAHHLTIQHGLVGNVMTIPGEAFSNPQQAMFHLQKFRDGIAGARVAGMKANTFGAQTWAYPQQFRVDGQRGGVSNFSVYPPAR